VIVLGLGNSCLDTLLALDHMPRPGGKARVLRRSEQTGGQVAGAMVACRRLGLEARFVLRTGDDAAGERQRAALAAEGIDLRWAKTIAATPSAEAIILTAHACSERVVLWRTPAELAVSAEEIETAMFAGVAALFLDGKDGPACLQAAAMARERGIPVVADLDCHYSHTPALLPWIDHLIVPEEFAAEWLPRHKLAEPPGAGQTIVVTRGSQGAEAWTPAGANVHSPAFAIAAVDTTGAGDAFHAGYVAALLEGRNLAERLAFANATAALACRAWGAQAGLPRRAEVEALLREAMPLA
jgi:sulfofructose kinase